MRLNPIILAACLALPCAAPGGAGAGGPVAAFPMPDEIRLEPTPFLLDDLSRVRELRVHARALGQDSSDQALAALYQRLFQLQDKRRDVEMRVDEAEFLMDDLTTAYSRADNDRWSKEELREVAVDPRHPRYPNITESAKLKILEEFRQKIRTVRLAEIEVKKIDRDTAEVKEMIKTHLDRRGQTPKP